VRVAGALDVGDDLPLVGERARQVRLRDLEPAEDAVVADAQDGEPERAHRTLGALDPVVRADLQAQLRSIFSRLGKTVVMVTHDVAEAVLFGATISLMTRGRIVQQGSFEELARRPAEPFVTEFLSAQAPPPEMAAYLRR
jgi:ABC-type microcin C transport system duplicated ATPase subunit YejF